LSIPFLSEQIPPEITRLLPLAIAGALSLSLSSIFQSAALARQKVARVAVARILRAVIMLPSQLGLIFFFGAEAAWLLAGEITANLAHATALGAFTPRRAGLAITSPRTRGFWRRLRRIGSRHKDFPIVTLPHAFVHAALGVALASSLGALYGLDTLGQYYLMRKLVFGALAVFSAGIYQAAVADASRATPKQLFDLALRTLIIMTFVTTVSAAIIALAAPALLGVAVGPDWKEAGLMATASLPLIILEPTTMTLAFLPPFLRLQHMAFAVAIAQGLFAIIALNTAAWLGCDVLNALAASAIGASSVMLAYIIFLLRKAKEAVARGLRHAPK